MGPADPRPPESPLPDPRPVIDTPRLRLRRLGPGDVPVLFGLFSDAEALRYWSHLPFTRRDEAEALFRTIDAHAVTGDLLQWGVELRATGTLAGTVTLASIDRANRRAEVGFMVGRAHWGHGVGSEAMRALAGHAFMPADQGGAGLLRLEADVDPRNAASLRALERLGFRREGLLRERWRVGGEAQDTVILGLLASEWAG